MGVHKVFYLKNQIEFITNIYLLCIVNNNKVIHSSKITILIIIFDTHRDTRNFLIMMSCRTHASFLGNNRQSSS